MNNYNIKITLSTSRYMLNHFKKYQLPNQKKQEDVIQVKILKEYVGKVRHDSTILLKDRKSNFVLNTPVMLRGDTTAAKLLVGVEVETSYVTGRY